MENFNLHNSVIKYIENGYNDNDFNVIYENMGGIYVDLYKKFNGCFYFRSMDDFKNFVDFTLIKSIKKFRLGTGVNFTSYFYRAVHNNLKNEGKKFITKGGKFTVSLNTPKYVNENDLTYELGDFIQDDKNLYNSVEATLIIEQVRELLEKRFSERDVDIFFSVYRDQIIMEEVGKNTTFLNQ